MHLNQFAGCCQARILCNFTYDDDYDFPQTKHEKRAARKEPEAFAYPNKTAALKAFKHEFNYEFPTQLPSITIAITSPSQTFAAAMLKSKGFKLVTKKRAGTGNVLSTWVRTQTHNNLGETD